MGAPVALDFMTPSPAWCVPHDSVLTVARLMVDHRCGVIPVVDDPRDRRPVGVITDRDIVTRVVARGLDASTCTAREIMSRKPVELRGDASFHTCAEAMREHHLRRLVVVDDRGRAIGIISEGDLARAARRHPQLEHDLAEMLGEITATFQPPADR